MGGTPTYVYRDGQRLTPYMLYQVNRLDADCRRLFGVGVVVTSAIRTEQEQIDIFLSRYVTAANVRGRRVYDTRVWNGVRYYRVSSAGTVAVPKTSNHEIQGTIAAVDLRDTGADAGIATMGSARSNWLRANAGNYDMIPEGFNFQEAWHYAIRNIFNTPPGGAPAAGGSTTSEEDNTMMFLRVRMKKGQHLIAVGEGVLRHFISTDPYDKIMRLSRSADDWQDVEGSELDALLYTYGVDIRDENGTKKAYRFTGGGAGFEVFVPHENKYRAGGMWSAINALRAGR